MIYMWNKQKGNNQTEDNRSTGKKYISMNIYAINLELTGPEFITDKIMSDLKTNRHPNITEIQLKDYQK